MKRELKHLKQQHSLLKPSYDSNVKKQKRFIVTATIGTIAFGTGYLLSKLDLFSHTESIQKIKDNEEHIVNLIKNQTSIIDSSNNI